MEGTQYFWYCNACGAQNSREDGECQFCECGGSSCERDNCSGPAHKMIPEFTDGLLAHVEEQSNKRRREERERSRRDDSHLDPGRRCNRGCGYCGRCT